jgi:PIN domain nuclease of toxin-antitoxin system
MGRYLLDTHVALWFFNGDDALSETAERIIRNLSNSIYLSVVSALEMAIKINIKKLRFPGNAAGFIRSAQANKITILPIDTAVPLVW